LNPFPVILNSSTQGKAISPRRAQVVLGKKINDNFDFLNQIDALRAKMQKKLS